MANKTRQLLKANAASVPIGANGPFQLALSHAMHIYESDAVYSVIPKNACSTLRLSVGIANGVLKNIGDINWIHKNTGAFRPALKDLAMAKFTFVVLRDPFKTPGGCISG